MPNQHPPILESAQEWTEDGKRFRIVRDNNGRWIREEHRGPQWWFENFITNLEVARFWICAWEREYKAACKSHGENNCHDNYKRIERAVHAMAYWRAVEAETLKGDNDE